MTNEELKAIRKEHGLSQIAMAEILGVSRTIYQTLEYGEREVDEGTQDAILAWIGSQDNEPREDELPEPAYEPKDDADADGPRGRRRAKAGKAGSMSAWQEETAVRLIALLQGEMLELDVDGVKHQVVMPGLAQVVSRFDEYDASVIYHGSPSLAVAVVKVAPRHPWLRSFLELSTLGGDYRELAVAVGGIVVPIAIHHGLFSPDNFSRNGQPGDEGSDHDEPE